MSFLTQSPAWQALQAHRLVMAPQHLCELFKQDPQRFSKNSLLFNDILLDYSKQSVNDETKKLLLMLARQQDLAGWISRMFQGEKINNTEHRAALHSALRSENPVMVGGVDLMSKVRRVLKQMERFSIAVHRGEYKGFSGKSFTDIVILVLVVLISGQ